MAGPQFLPVREAAKQAGRCIQTVRRWARAGLVDTKPVKINGRWHLEYRVTQVREMSE